MTPMTDTTVIRTFALAGKACVTVKSVKTQTRFTLKLTKTKKGDAHFVSLLTGSDNTASYSYLGLLTPAGQIRRTAKSRIGEGAPGFQAAKFFCERVLSAAAVPAGLEVWHEGHCGRCNRLLTDPESIARGIGPECIKKMES